MINIKEFKLNDYEKTMRDIFVSLITKIQRPYALTPDQIFENCENSTNLFFNHVLVKRIQSAREELGNEN